MDERGSIPRPRSPLKIRAKKAIPVTRPLAIVFAGTPEFALPALDAVLASEHRVVAVLTPPDRPAGRGRQLRPSAVKQRAIDAAIPVLQPTSLKTREPQNALAALAPDVIVVVAYGLILPPEVLALPRLGCWNIHASILPRWRGAAPIQRAILAGDRQTGISIMQMDEGLDTGPVLAHARAAISQHDTAGDLHDRLARLGARTLLHCLAEPQTLHAQPQDPTQAVYAAKLSKSEAELDWREPASQLARQVHAFNPWPVAWCQLNQMRLRVWSAQALDGQAPPGRVTQANANGIDVGTGTGLLRLTEIQAPGARRMAAADFLNAHRFAVYASND